MRTLVVWGADYIGSHIVKMLAGSGSEVVAYDNLSSGHRAAILAEQFIEAGLADADSLDAALQDGIDAVMHFASSIQVGESMRDLAKYYRNNVANTLNLLESMVARGVKRFIFSSTAAIFGELNRCAREGLPDA